MTKALTYKEYLNSPGLFEFDCTPEENNRLTKLRIFIRLRGDLKGSVFFKSHLTPCYYNGWRLSDRQWHHVTFTARNHRRTRRFATLDALEQFVLTQPD